MNTFEQTIKKILSENDNGLLGCDYCNGYYTNLSPIIMQNLYMQAIDQNEFSELAPVPKPLLNFLCSKVRTKVSNSYTITYKEIYQLLKEYQYKDLYDFKKVLQILKVYDSGYLTIAITNYQYNEFYKHIKSFYMTDQRIDLFFSICNKDHSGDTFSGNSILKAKFKNACIWLNKQWIIHNSNWKDTLSHELTHFIHRVVILERTTYTGKIQKKLLDNNEISFNNQVNENFNIIFKKRITNRIALIYLKSLFKGTLFNREQSTTIQNILNGFQRMYQQQKIINDKVSYKHLESNHQSQKYQKQRLTFLNKLLSEINDLNFFNTQLGQTILNNLLDFNQQKVKSTFSYQKEFKDSILILQYLGVKYLLPQWNIDQKLFKHFKIFKFRDN